MILFVWGLTLGEILVGTFAFGGEKKKFSFLLEELYL